MILTSHRLWRLRIKPGQDGVTMRLAHSRNPAGLLTLDPACLPARKPFC